MTSNKFEKLKSDVAEAMALLSAGPEDEVYMTSVLNRDKGIVPGRVSVNTLGVAAILVAQGTHRQATPQEIATWKADQAAKKAASEAEQARKDGKINLDMSDFLSKFLEAASGASRPAVAEPPAAPSGKRTSSPQFPVPPAA